MSSLTFAGDGIPNWWEMVNGYDPLDPNAPIAELFSWYAPVILTIGVATSLLVVILFLGRHRIKSWVGRKSDTDAIPS
jgi:hypothetical protein